MKKRIFILSLLVLIGVTSVKASSIKDTITTPVIGQLCPDLFFNKTINFDRPSFNLHELRGKWVLLDFWDWGCSGCIASFPHVSEMQRQFKDRVQILMVTTDDWEGKNAAIYNRYMNMLKLNMPCVFNGFFDKDHSLTGVFKQFNINSLGRAILIDPQGIVRAYTGVIHADELQLLLDGKTPTFDYDRFAPTFKRLAYNTIKPYLIDGNGGKDSDFEFRSLLSKASPNLGGGDDFVFDFSPYWDRYSKPAAGRLEMINVNLKQLYRTAYFHGVGSEEIDNNYFKNQLYWQFPILEIKDTSQFVADNLNKNKFCYSLIAPASKCTSDFMFSTMQEDLKHYFGYSAAIETRKMPYYRVIVINPKLVKKFRTKGGETKEEEIIHLLSVKFTNYPINVFVKKLSSLKDTPFVDETGIDYNIDLTYTAPYGNFDGNNEALGKIGLKIVKSEKVMKVLVIRDPKPDSSVVN